MDIERLVQRVARQHRLLEARLSRAEELADAIGCDLANLERAIARAPVEAASRPTRIRQRLGTSLDVRVKEIEIRRRPDDWGLVRIDQSEEFELPPVLTELLAILSADSGLSDDELVAWQSLDEVAKRLQKHRGRALTRHAVTQLVYRLRRELLARGQVSPSLVQTSRRLGVRAAVRRRPLATVWS